METIKERNKGWQNGTAKNITFIVTKDCQLACKYCYLVGKNSKERMTWEVAKAAIDYILDHEDEMKEESVVWDFIGGEPFLEIELIDKICDYLSWRCFAVTTIGLIPTASLSPLTASIMIRKRYRTSSRKIENI